MSQSSTAHDICFCKFVHMWEFRVTKKMHLLFNARYRKRCIIRNNNDFYMPRTIFMYPKIYYWFSMKKWIQKYVLIQNISESEIKVESYLSIQTPKNYLFNASFQNKRKRIHNQKLVEVEHKGKWKKRWREELPHSTNASSDTRVFSVTFLYY